MLKKERRPRIVRNGIVLVATSLTLLSAACAAPRAESGSAFDGAVTDSVKSAIAEEGPVVLLQNNWTSQLIQSRLAYRVLQEMGAQAEIAPVDWAASFPAMASSDDTVLMELWDLTSKDLLEKFVETDKSVVDLGDTGPSAEEGWYVPTYVIEGDPARGIEPTCPGLPNWEALNDCVDAFAATPGAKGRYFSGDVAWGEQYGDVQRIENLDLNYEISFAGSEAALGAEFSRAYERGEPILGLMWAPHFLTAKYDLTRVEFPAYSDECWGTTYACNWGDISLRKMASADFAENHPVAAAFLDKYTLTDDALDSMMVNVDEGGMSVDEAVDEWMEASPGTWQAWIPTDVS
ncbi:glycine betaine ABC transporter substrate-binding protein [Rhodococcus sp. IEGM 1409]|uniref:glycine betaine ABC transporter substrate-binding protein n=1 Tax=Rhodococcus sp. IEGM 1409 TaxID=3047082 RepID=UPI0024B7A695|nr:glycine betaine ABC transporter substrate-binding protein [Rhodococcus sp. IEGM 1409]MDI9903295.1 glycine betaine ABC transporter substrate-binding protein [Rhodococcus sp. IEGM 1409]